MLKLGKNPAGTSKYTPEELAIMPLDTVKKFITEQVPDAFTPKVKKAANKSTAKKATSKKPAAKKPASAVKK